MICLNIHERKNIQRINHHRQIPARKTQSLRKNNEG
jgi:hypothetical protein